MDKSISNTSNLDSYFNYPNSFNDEENNINQFKDSINHKNENKEILLDIVETGISNHKKEDFIDNNLDLNVNEPNANLIGKKKEEPSKKKHDKFAKDNIIKKIITILLEYLFKFINLLINERYKGNIGYDVHIKQLLKIDKENILSSRYNKLLLKTTLKAIFSGNFLNSDSKRDFSKKYTKTYKLDHNNKLINELLNDKDEKKRDFFNRLFNLTFIDCINHLTRKNIFEQLNGLDSLENILKKFNNDIEYKDLLNYYFSNFEEIIRKSRIKKIKHN